MKKSCLARSAHLSRYVVRVRDTIFEFCQQRLTVRHQRRPAAISARCQAILHMLYGNDLHDEKSALYITRRDGSRQLGRALCDILALAELVDLGAVDGQRWIHWCAVDHGAGDDTQIGSDEERPAPKPGCANFQESVEKVGVALVNALVHRRWERSAESRWTYVLGALRKVALGFLAYRAMPDALVDMKLHWNLSDSLIPALAALINADSNDFAAKSKLRWG